MSKNSNHLIYLKVACSELRRTVSIFVIADHFMLRWKSRNELREFRIREADYMLSTKQSAVCGYFYFVFVANRGSFMIVMSV